jgi:hypothetical protein
VRPGWVRVRGGASGAGGAGGSRPRREVRVDRVLPDPGFPPIACCRIEVPADRVLPDPRFSPIVPFTRTVGGKVGSQPTNSPLVRPAGTSGENLGFDGHEWRDVRLDGGRVARTSAWWGRLARTSAQRAGAASHRGMGTIRERVGSPLARGVTRRSGIRVSPRHPRARAGARRPGGTAAPHSPALGPEGWKPVPPREGAGPADRLAHPALTSPTSRPSGLRPEAGRRGGGGVVRVRGGTIGGACGSPAGPDRADQAG